MISNLIQTFIYPLCTDRLDSEADFEDTGCQKLNAFVWCMLISIWYIISHFRKWGHGLDRSGSG